MTSASDDWTGAVSGAADEKATDAESTYAWVRLVAAVCLSTIGGVGMWSVVVALPALQAEFGVARSAASLPYTLTMISFGVGGVLMGRLADRFGVIVPVILGTAALGIGYIVAGSARTLWEFSLVQGVLLRLRARLPGPRARLVCPQVHCNGCSALPAWPVV